MRGTPAANNGPEAGKKVESRSCGLAPSPRFSSALACTLALFIAPALVGCNEVNGRRLIQKANALYHEGEYKDAIVKFEEAEKLVPNFPTLYLNKGYTCKRMIIPGTKTPEVFKAAQCALKAFETFKKLAPDDPRGDMLYTQTLFDADRYSTLAEIYEKRFRENPKDTQNVSVLMQVYSKWDIATLMEGGKLEEALKWYRTSVEQSPDNAEAYYAVGTYIYTQLMTRGGGTDKQLWDPRPGAVNNKQPTGPLPPIETDIIGERRIELADEGIQYLEKALELRPTYTDAMTYLNLLWRQRSFAFFDKPDQWYENLLKAEEWKEKTLAILRERAGMKSDEAAADTGGKAGSKAGSKKDIKLTEMRDAFGAHHADDADEDEDEVEEGGAPAAASKNQRRPKRRKAPRRRRKR